MIVQYSQYNGTPAPTQDKTAPVEASVGGEPGAIVADGAHSSVVSELNTIMPSVIVAEPGKDVFANDVREAKKSVARHESDQRDEERVVSVVSVEGVSGTAVESVEGGAAGAREHLEVVETSSVSVFSVEKQTEVPAGIKPEGPLDHEEALADQVAHELYPEARDVLEEGLVHDE